MIKTTMINIAECTQDLLNGDFLLSNWNLAYSSNLFTQVFYYLIPVKLLGFCTTSVYLSLFLIVISTIFTGCLLLKDNLKDIEFKDICLFIFLYGLSDVAFQSLQMNGASLPFVFLILFFSNKFLKTEKNLYLIITAILSVFLVFGDIFSLILCFIPMLIYCGVSIFFNQDRIKYIKLLLVILLTVSLGIFLDLQYIIYNNSGAIYQWFSTKSFIDDYTSADNISNINIFIRKFVEIQNMNFFSEYIFAPTVLLYIFRTILTIAGLILVFKNIMNLYTNRKEHNDLICFSISTSIIFIVFLSIMLEADLREYAEYVFGIIPLGLAIIIMRANICFSKLNKFQYLTLFITAALIFVCFCNKKFLEEEHGGSKYALIAKILLTRNLEYGYGHYEDSAILSLFTKGKIKIYPIINNLPYNAIMKKHYFDEEHQFYLIWLYETDTYERLLLNKKFYKITVDDSIITVLLKQ